MAGLLINILLVCLVAILTVLLIIRQRQIKQLAPVNDLEQVLKGLMANVLISRSEGKIQKVAGQLSNILITNLQSKHILFFRRQKRFLEMNYVYGMKNIQRSRFRTPVSPDFMRRLTDAVPIREPHELSEYLGEDFASFLKENQFNLAFPIFWVDNLFGIYFIRTELPVNHPLVQTFLLFLNQNLSITYQLSKMESARQVLEQKYKNEVKRNSLARASANNTLPTADTYPGHLVEVFSYHNVPDLMSNLFTKLKVGLKAERLVYFSQPRNSGKTGHSFTIGVNGDSFSMEGPEIQKISGAMEKSKIYSIDSVPGDSLDTALMERIKKEQIQRITKFSLRDNEPGILLWTGKSGDESGDNRLLSRLEKIGRQAMQNAVEFERVEERSHTDSLTGLYNYRYLVRRLGEEIQRAKRYQRKLGLLLFDIDDFKTYNDTYGHQWGDELLRKMGATLSHNLRSIDIVARYGGDEFCIIMPEADKATCNIFMDRLRFAIANADFRDTDGEFKGRITISIGAAVFPEDAESGEKLIYCSDMALLRSKASGRNCNTLYSEDIISRYDS